MFQVSLIKTYLYICPTNQKDLRLRYFTYKIDNSRNVKLPEEARPSVLAERAFRVKFNKEKVTNAFRALKGPQAIELDTHSPSPKKRSRDKVDAEDAERSSKSACRDAPSSYTIPTPEFAGHSREM